VVTRAATWALAGFTVIAFADSLNPERSRWDSPRLHDLGAMIDVWARWDSDWYLRIADGWYDWPSSTPAFFPLYPALVGVVSRVLGDHGVLAGVLVSTLAAAVAFVVLHRLVLLLLSDDRPADRSVLLLALFPTSFFLTAVYSESLFLLLALAAFWLAERGRLVAAVIIVGLTRSQGIALVAALAVLVWRQRGPRGLPLVGIPLAMFATYPLALWLGVGHPFAFVTAQRVVWDRSFDPVGGLAGAVTAIWDGNLFEFAVLALMLPLAIVAWRRLGAAYGVYAVGILLVPVVFPSARFGALYSLPRFALVAFPCFVALALLARRPVLWWSTVGAFSVGLAVLVVRWSLWQWVA
jgi:hypothetical protein